MVRHWLYNASRQPVGVGSKYFDKLLTDYYLLTFIMEQYKTEKLLGEDYIAIGYYYHAIYFSLCYNYYTIL